MVVENRASAEDVEAADTSMICKHRRRTSFELLHNLQVIM